MNRKLRSVRTILGYLRKLGLLPRISADDLKNGLERLSIGSERVDYRKPHELRQLLEAAMRHDAQVFEATRDDHAQGRGSAGRPPGMTARYQPVAGSGWQALRRMRGTYLTNAGGIFGAASAYRSAKQLGHSVQVAERHYLDVARGIPRDARTLEAAMQIAEQLERVIAAATMGHRVTLDVRRNAS